MNVRKLCVSALMTALLCVAAPFTIPVEPIPLSLATLFVYLAGALLGARDGCMAVAAYLLLGIAGLPVFTNFAGGLSKLAGPTGGYLVGYLPCVLLTGLAWEKFGGKIAADAIGMVLGTAVLYAFGTMWYCMMSQTPFVAALSVCVLPFLPGDAITIVAACAAARPLRKAVRAAPRKRDT